MNCSESTDNSGRQAESIRQIEDRADAEANARICHTNHSEPCEQSLAGHAGLLLALSLHSVLEGIAVGVQDTSAKVNPVKFRPKKFLTHYFPFTGPSPARRRRLPQIRSWFLSRCGALIYARLAFSQSLVGNTHLLVWLNCRNWHWHGAC